MLTWKDSNVIHMLSNWGSIYGIFNMLFADTLDHHVDLVIRGYT